MASPKNNRRIFLASLAGAALAVSLPGTQSFAQESTRGFDQVIPAYASGAERARQPDIWVMHVELKPIRLAFVDIKDPQTNETKREQVWYMAYRAVPRAVAVRQDNDDLEPINVLDPLPGPPLFIPKLTLVAYENPKTEIPSRIYQDLVVPEATVAINQIERPRNPDEFLRDSASVVRELPPSVPEDATDQPWIYGVATWRNIDPDTDFFKVIFSGFSNGYERLATEADANALVSRKVLVQKFLRRGDRFDPTLKEFHFDGSGTWIYAPDEKLKSGDVKEDLTAPAADAPPVDAAADEAAADDNN